MSNKTPQSILDDILDDIVEKQYSVSLAIKGRISFTTFYKMLKETNNLEKYARATEIRAEKMADEILDIADSSENDTIKTEKGEFQNTEWIQRSRLRVDSRKWLMSKMLPKKYGDKIDITSGNDKISQPQIIVRDDVQAKIIDDLLKKE